jgi:catechol 2,3-dioxygenase-like lactoylglutathione lyase family enzyme
MIGDLQLRLAVPNLGRAIRFYSTLLDTAPVATERRLAWFHVPGSVLDLELHEDDEVAPANVRLCVEPEWLKVAGARLGRAQLSVARSGLARAGDPALPRALMLADPAGNRWELCTPLLPHADGTDHPIASRGRAVLEFTRRLLAPSPMEVRFERERMRSEALIHRHMGVARFP